MSALKKQTGEVIITLLNQQKYQWEKYSTSQKSKGGNTPIFVIAWTVGMVDYSKKQIRQAATTKDLCCGISYVQAWIHGV